MARYVLLSLVLCGACNRESQQGADASASMDLAHGAADLASTSADLATISSDLATVDLATADLSLPADMTPPPDLLPPLSPFTCSAAELLTGGAYSLCLHPVIAGLPDGTPAATGSVWTLSSEVPPGGTADIISGCTADHLTCWDIR